MMKFLLFLNPMLLSLNPTVLLLSAKCSFVTVFMLSRQTLLLASNTIFSSQLFHIRARPTMFASNLFCPPAKMSFLASALSTTRFCPHPSDSVSQPERSIMIIGPETQHRHEMRLLYQPIYDQLSIPPYVKTFDELDWRDLDNLPVLNALDREAIANLYDKLHRRPS